MSIAISSVLSDIKLELSDNGVTQIMPDETYIEQIQFDIPEVYVDIMSQTGKMIAKEYDDITFVADTFFYDIASASIRDVRDKSTAYEYRYKEGLADAISDLANTAFFESGTTLIINNGYYDYLRGQLCLYPVYPGNVIRVVYNAECPTITDEKDTLDWNRTWVKALVHRVAESYFRKQNNSPAETKEDHLYNRALAVIAKEKRNVHANVQENMGTTIIDG